MIAGIGNGRSDYVAKRKKIDELLKGEIAEETHATESVLASHKGGESI